MDDWIVRQQQQDLIRQQQMQQDLIQQQQMQQNLIQQQQVQQNLIQQQQQQQDLVRQQQQQNMISQQQAQDDLVRQQLESQRANQEIYISERIASYNPNYQSGPFDVSGSVNRPLEEQERYNQRLQDELFRQQQIQQDLVRQQQQNDLIQQMQQDLIRQQQMQQNLIQQQPQQDLIPQQQQDPARQQQQQEDLARQQQIQDYSSSQQAQEDLIRKQQLQEDFVRQQLESQRANQEIYISERIASYNPNYQSGPFDVPGSENRPQQELERHNQQLQDELFRQRQMQDEFIRQQQLVRNELIAQEQSYLPTTTGSAADARKHFKGLRDEYAERLGVGQGGQVHHAIELQVLNRYPGAFTEAELNAFENMRGIPAEREERRQLHNSKIREVLDRHYHRMDQEIAERGLEVGTSAYNDYVRRNLSDARDELDYVVGQFFSEYRTGRSRSFD